MKMLDVGGAELLVIEARRRRPRIRKGPPFLGGKEAMKDEVRTVDNDNRCVFIETRDAWRRHYD